MGYERSEKPPKLSEMIDFICNYRPTNRKKMLEYSWVIQQEPKKIYAIYYQFLADYQSRLFEEAVISQHFQKNNKSQEVQENENNQITFDEVYPDLIANATHNSNELSDEEIEELLALSHETEEYTDDYYDDYGRLMSDARRMERRENTRIHRRVSGIPYLIANATHNSNELSDEEFEELLALSHETEEYTDDYYDDYGRLMSDVRRMERRENARIRRRVSRIPY